MSNEQERGTQLAEKYKDDPEFLKERIRILEGELTVLAAKNKRYAEALRLFEEILDPNQLMPKEQETMKAIFLEAQKEKP